MQMRKKIRNCAVTNIRKVASDFFLRVLLQFSYLQKRLISKKKQFTNCIFCELAVSEKKLACGS